jgi:hypothetical protein
MQRVVRCLVFVLAALAALVPSAGAEQTTDVLVFPASTVVEPGDEFVVDVEIRSVSDLYGADIDLSFDPATLEALGVAVGSFLPPPVFEAGKTLDNVAGQVRYVVALMAPAPAVSGSGVLARITFRALQPGTSELGLEVMLANDQAEPIPVVVTGGSVVVSGATLSPTATRSPTATGTRTATMVPSSTPTATATASPAVTVTRTRTPTGQPAPTATATTTRTPAGPPTATGQPPAHRLLLPIVLRGYPEPAASPTATITPTLTPSATLSPTPYYQQLVRNASFETDEAWTLLGGYAPGYSLSRARSGLRSMRLGILAPYPHPVYSSVQQTLDLPGGATEVVLSLYYFPVSSSEDTDYLYVVIYRASDGTRLRTDRRKDRHQAWNLWTLDLQEFAGQSIRVQVGLYNDGQGVTAVYLDDVEVWVAVTNS